MVPFAGWEMPVDYGSQLDEHAVVRNGVGLFDVSHMGQVRLRGARVLEYLDLLVPANIGRLTDGGSIYTTLCTPSGGVVDDLIITRLSATEAFAVVNAGTRLNDVAWMMSKRGALGFDDVSITDESDAWAMIAVQGPDALALLERLIPGTQWTATRSFTLHQVAAEGDDLIVSRTGYTGENGAEVLCPAASAEKWWELLVAAGARPCGLGARDSLRLEMGYSLYGHELSETITPLEAGIAWTVSFKKEARFIGREALEREKAAGSTRRIVGLRLDNRRPLRAGDPVSDGVTEVGALTSGGYSPTLGVGIGLALVTAEAAARPELLVVKGGKPLAAAVTKPPFVQVKSQPVK
jgi:aminomethyltransferase